jgi:hypothetical protein
VAVSLPIWVAIGLILLQPFDVLAQSSMSHPGGGTIDNLMVVLRESPGGNKQDEGLRPIGKVRVKLEGKEVEFEPAWFEFIGDMHIRFVFDYPDSMSNLSTQDLAKLKLTPQQALEIAVANIKRVYGSPTSQSWTSGLLQVKGKSPDLDSSYFLDREFWRGLSKRHPEGLVVSVAKRGGLVYTPLSNSKAVEGLRKGVAYLHSSSEHMRVSAALYLFKDDRWTVFQPAK